MSLEFVAAYLQRETELRVGAGERDWFGRSSFNRFYYAAFLKVRAAFGEMEPEWLGMGHASIPTHLKDCIEKRLKKGHEQARRAQDSHTMQVCNIAITACRNLADLMRDAYASRVTADYRIEIPVAYGPGAAFKLNEISIDIAKQWPRKAQAFTISIKSAWRQI